jgi:predicted glycosyltransferase
MRVWIDLANSPHVPLFEPVVERLRRDGCDVVLTVRDHAQTLDLAEQAFRDVLVVGGESPAGRARKLAQIGTRARRLLGVAQEKKPDVALSHGSYAQLVAARMARVPGVTMMDYEHQPANHLSFRLANRVIVPEVFPDDALRRFGARDRKVVRYDGFKEELYLGPLEPNRTALDELGVGANDVLVVFRPPPEGALYHRMGNERFERVLEAASSGAARVVVLPRGHAQRARYTGMEGVIVPQRALDGSSLLYHADVMIGAGGTMNREAALLGTPTYTMFAGRLAAVDAELMRRGLLHDLRSSVEDVPLVKKPARDPATARERADRILQLVVDTVRSVARRRTY